MRLIEFSYRDADWEIRNLEFGMVSLIVGKNSTGKSKTLSSIDLLGKIITQKVNLPVETDWDISFITDDSVIFNYKFRTGIQQDDIVVLYEQITRNEETVLLRNTPEKATIKNILSKEELINPPTNKLIVHTTRDVKKYPYLEEIAIWAERSFGFKFGTIGPDKGFSKQEYNLLTTVEEIPTLYKSLGNRNKGQIIAYFNQIGYDIEEISFKEENTGMSLFVKESGLKNFIPHHQLSQGMFRSLSVLIFLEYLITRKKPATVVIDDLCEGLDYERATKLGKIVFDNCQKNNIQLVATSNDMFLMDVVDLNNWNVLQRSGKIVTALNAKNQSDLFENFRYTGLSNFDFFASDYIAQKMEK